MGRKIGMKNQHKFLLFALTLILSLAFPVVYAYAGSPNAVAGALSPQSQEEVNDVITKRLYLPLVNKEFMDLKVDTQDRVSSAAFFNNVYYASAGTYEDWTGNFNNCNAGTTSPEFKQAVRLRINYFRAMAGVPANVAFSDVYNRKAQQAALMMSVNGEVNHTPPSTWECFTEEGDEAAQNSNLFYGYFGWDAITGYVRDPGIGNYAAGHRRWVLFPQTQYMGTGDIPPGSCHQAANDLWVFDDNIWGPRPETREEFVAWPPPGYVPYQVVFPRWSFSYAQADFSSASVSMMSGGVSITTHPQPIVIGYGENTFVWEPEVNFSRPPASDTSHTVTISNVLINGSPRDFTYEVIVFDPDS
jgi:uncharacterized protein YkwD